MTASRSEDSSKALVTSSDALVTESGDMAPNMAIPKPSSAPNCSCRDRSMVNVT